MFDSEEFERRRWRVVVVAHEERKRALVEFLRRQRDNLAGWRLLTTPDIADAIGPDRGLSVRSVVPEAWDVDQWLPSRLGSGEIDALIILRDPRLTHVGEPAPTVHQLADTLGIPIATNVATAACVIAGLLSRPGPAASSRCTRTASEEGPRQGRGTPPCYSRQVLFLTTNR